MPNQTSTNVPSESFSSVRELLSFLHQYSVKQNSNNPKTNNDQICLQQLNVPISTNELERLRILREIEILDTANEECFDRYASLARRYFDVPVALISLIDVSRHWIKSNMGMEKISEIKRDISFCFYTVLESSPDVYVVPDVTKDERFQNNVFVTDALHIRFYAGACIKVQGVKVGSLCIIDTKPRSDFTAAKAAILQELAEMVAALMEERRRNALQLREELAKMTLSVLNTFNQPLLQELAITNLTNDVSMITHLPNGYEIIVD